MNFYFRLLTITFRNTVVLFITLTSIPAVAQQRVLFADSLEQRSEVNKIKVQAGDYQTMKVGTMSLINFKTYSERETVSFSQEKKKSPLLLRLLTNKSLSDKDTYTTAEFKITDQLSYDLIGPGGREASVTALRESNKKVNEVQLQNNSRISSIPLDTSYLKAELHVGADQKLCALDVVFQGEGGQSIQGIAVFGSDTLFIASTDKAIKYHALGVEVRRNKRVIAGMQLPDLHIGPSYTVVDRTLTGDLRSLAYSILSVVLFCNETRE